ncbi:MAG: hypothetical protein ACRD6N_08235, partial [Pyrinomonadaceae bacterium]
GRNTVLVDGNPESQNIADTPQFAALNSYPRITDAVTSDFYDSVTSELASVYQGRLERFTRRIVFVKPHYLVVFDDLKGRGAPARFDWLLHLPNRQGVETKDGFALYRGKQAALAVRAFSPDHSRMEVRAGRVPYPEFATRTPAQVPAQPAFLDLSSGPVDAARFLVALVPTKTGEAARALAESMTEIKESVWVGIRTNREKETDLIMFRTAGSGNDGRYGEWLTDAAAWTVTESSERLRVLSAHSVRSVSRSGRVLFNSDKPASFAVRFDANAVVATVSVTQPTQIRLATGGAPTKVRLDGRELPTTAVRYSSAKQMTQATIPAGQHEVVFALR